jgi:hypothetical protein
LFVYVKTQKCLSNYDLVALIQNLRTSGQQSTAPVYKRSIRRAKVLDQICVITMEDPSVSARNLRVRIVSIKINIGEDTVVRVPTSDIALVSGKDELGVRGIASLNDQARVPLGNL